MSISAISSSHVLAAYTPPVRQQQPAQASQQTRKADTVTISPQAQQLANDGDPAALEAMESSAEKSSEVQRWKA